MPTTYKQRIKAMRLPNDLVLELCKRIRPIIRDETGVGWYIEQPDPFKVAYAWSPVKDSPSPKNLVEIARERAYSWWGYYGLFKPSIAECLYSLPHDLYEEVVAFEIKDAPETMQDMNNEQAAFNAGCHVFTVAFYRVMTPEEEELC